MENTDYSYINGRLKAMDTKMLTANTVERMIDAQSAEEAYRALNDLTFISGVIGEHGVDEFQTVLTKATERMLGLIKRMAPYSEVANFLYLKYDFHNLKIALKARLVKHGYADVEHALINIGTLSVEQWEQFLLEGSIPPLTKDMHEAIEEASKAYEKTENPQLVDMFVDKNYLEEMLLLAEKLQSQLTIGYVKHLIDLTNLKTFIRCKELKKEENYFESVTLHGGYIALETFTESYKKSYEELRGALEQRMHSTDLVAVLDEFIKEGTLLSSEKKMSELLHEYMQVSSRMPFGPEYVFTFFWKFENHMQVLRTILVGKLNQLTNEEISKHVLSI
jgi:V/A-type H+-transporting ATPase subunit C